MKTISWRVQLGLIAVGYAAVLAYAASLLHTRHLQELNHPADVMASGGMYAGGDMLLEIFIACLVMIPTFFLVRVMAKYEALYTVYSQVLLGISLSAPVSLSVLYLGRNYLANFIVVFCFLRLMWSPLILAGMGISRLMARFNRAKRAAAYALLIEGVTLGVAVALVIHGAGAGQH